MAIRLLISSFIYFDISKQIVKVYGYNTYDTWCNETDYFGSL